MTKELLWQLAHLGIALLMAVLVWQYYRERPVAPSERYATFGPRFWTGTVDACVMWPLDLLTAPLLASNVAPALAAVLLILQNLAWLFYTVLMHARYGQTVGKMVTKVRVVDVRTEGPISVGQAWLREGIPMLLGVGLLAYQVATLLTGSASPQAVATGVAFASSRPFWLLTALPFLWFAAEAVTMLTNPRRRAVHDFIAGTIVVRINTAESGPELAKAPAAGPAGDVNSDKCGGL